MVDWALAGSHCFASFFSAPVSFLDSGKARTSTTTQKPTTIHLVQLPAGISAIFLSVLIASSSGSSAGQYRSPGPSSPSPADRLVLPDTELDTAASVPAGNCAMSWTLRTRSPRVAHRR